MTGPEHYKAAEELCERARKARGLPAVDQILVQAQVHATLALAAATALQTPSGEDGGMYVRDAEEWERACSLVAPEKTP